MLKDFLTDESHQDTLDPADLSVEEQKAFYGTLFAMAAADETVDREEMELIFETLDLKNLGEEDRSEVHGYLVDPPELSGCLEELQHADEVLRYGLMLNLIEVAVADDSLHDREKEYIAEAQEKLNITDDQVDKMENFAREVERISERGIDDDHAADSLRDASSQLAGAGIPEASVAYSTSIGGLGAAGIAYGLGAVLLGIGAGPIVAGPMIGGGIYYLLRKIFGMYKEREEEKRRRERERKTQLAIQNLQETISTLVDQLEVLQEDAAKAEANKEAVEKLSERLQKLKQVLKQREAQLAST